MWILPVSRDLSPECGLACFHIRKWKLYGIYEMQYRSHFFHTKTSIYNYLLRNLENHSNSGEADN